MKEQAQRAAPTKPHPRILPLPALKILCQNDTGVPDSRSKALCLKLGLADSQHRSVSGVQRSDDMYVGAMEAHSVGHASQSCGTHG